MKLEQIQINPGIKMSYKFFGKKKEGEDYRNHFITWVKYTIRFRNENNTLSDIVDRWEFRISINFILFWIKILFEKQNPEYEQKRESHN